MVIASRSRALPWRGRMRRGATTTALLVLYSVLLIVLLWASQQLSFRSHARVELQNADDAAAHAAARELLNDSVFAQPYVSGTAQVDLRTTLITNARKSGERLAGLNRVMGGPLTIIDNPQNLTHGELYVGTLDDPASRTFINLTNTYFDPYNPDLNAVRVKQNAARSRVKASATYYVDRDVVGFRLKQPATSSPTFPSIPLVPIAILSSPCPPAQNTCWLARGNDGTNTWENQVMGRHGQDEWKMGTDPNTGAPVPVQGQDGIPEITITLTPGGAASDNAQLVFFDSSKAGTTSTAVDMLLTQIQNGVAYADLPAPPNGQAAGQFLLNLSDSVPPPPAGTAPPTANVATPATLALQNGWAALLAQGDPNQQPNATSGLQGILGRPRVWMLYSGAPSGTANPTINVVGFVVARVMSVRGTQGGPLTAVLQPSVLVTDTAVTDWTLRTLGPRTLYNPYIGRLRFVE